jgi:hypothetical protein
MDQKEKSNAAYSMLFVDFDRRRSAGLSGLFPAPAPSTSYGPAGMVSPFLPLPYCPLRVITIITIFLGSKPAPKKEGPRAGPLD